MGGCPQDGETDDGVRLLTRGDAGTSENAENLAHSRIDPGQCKGGIEAKKTGTGLRAEAPANPVITRPRSEAGPDV